jgi:predicted PurR-regulated permease PerM
MPTSDSAFYLQRTVRAAFLAALGAAIGYAGLLAVHRVSEVLLLVLVSIVLALGLDLPVAFLARHGMRRRIAVLAVLFGTLAAGAGLVAAVAPALVAQTRALVAHLPTYAKELRSNTSVLGRLETRFHVEALAESFAHRATSAHSGLPVHRLVGVGEAFLSGVGSTILVIALTCYLLADRPRIEEVAYRLVPATRRAAARRLGDEIAAKVGGYVLGNLLTSLIAGVGTLIWLLALGVPYPLALALLVAVFDLVPVIGSTVGGVLVTLVALTRSLPVGLATAGFYVAYRLLEDYLLVPKVMRRTVDVSPLVTVLALLIGGALFGIIGALLAVPVAAAIQLLVVELALPRLDRI